jgi:hypothetical protein
LNVTFHPLAAAFATAWNEHRPQVVTPDAFWLTIAQGFARHVLQNAEALRHRFVRFGPEQGDSDPLTPGAKIQIVVRRDDFIKGSPRNDWPSSFGQVSDAVAEYIGPARDLVVADFSTTGAVERAASEIVLMEALSAWFEYGWVSRCGIPRVTVEGTPEDWQRMGARVRELGTFGLERWTGEVVPILDEIARTAAGGAPDRDFWHEAVRWDGRSGGPYITGWVTRLFHVVGGEGATNDPRDRGFVAMRELPSAVSRVPFTWDYLDHTFPMYLAGGLVGVAIDDDTGAVRPVAGWAVGDVEGVDDALERMPAPSHPAA